MSSPAAGDAGMAPRRVLAQVRALRLRRRRLRSLDGVTRLVALAVVLVAISFVVDYSLDLPIAVRVIHTVLSLLLVTLGLRIFVLAARRPVSDVWLARQIEVATDAPDQAMVTAVQLASGASPHAPLYSPYLLARTVAEAEERIAGVRAADLVSRRGLVASAGLLFLFAAPAVLLVTARPDLAAVYARRDVLFQDVPWPRTYELQVLQPEREVRVAMGDPVTVLVDKLRGGDARVQAEVRREGGSDELRTLEKKGVHRYRTVFRNVTQDFTFRVRCGDFVSARHQVLVRNRPRVEEIVLTFDYPDYTGLDTIAAESGAPAGSAHGHVKVPVGTVVRYRARSSIPVQSVTWVNEFQLGGEARTVERDVPVEGEREFSDSFTPEQRGIYYFRLVSTDGFENPSPIRYRIEVVPDQAPAIQILRPDRNLEVSARARFDVRLEAYDDYGLTGGRVVLRPETLDAETGRAPVDGADPGGASPDGEPASAGDPGGGGTAETAVLAELQAPALASDAKKAEDVIALDLEVITAGAAAADGGFAAGSGGAAIEGTRIELFAEAFDARGQVGRSRILVLTVVPAEELTRILQDDLTLIRESLEQTLELQKDARSEVEGVFEHARLGDGGVPVAELPALRHARLNQERVSGRLEEDEARLVELLERVVANRLVWNELPRIQGIAERLGQLSRELAPPALDGLAELVRHTGSGEVKGGEIEGVLERQRDVARALRELLGDLREWGDLRSLIRKFEELLGRQRELEQNVESKIRQRQGAPAGGR